MNQPANDPMGEIILAHRALSAAWYALPSEDRERVSYPSFGDELDEYPTPTTQAGATAALRLAIEFSDERLIDRDIRELTAAALRFLEKQEGTMSTTPFRKAAADLLPGADSTMSIEACDARMAKLCGDIASIKDQLAHHSERVQAKMEPLNVHWTDRARGARRAKEAELAELRLLRASLRPPRDAFLQAIVEIVQEKLDPDEFEALKTEARQRMARAAA